MKNDCQTARFIFGKDVKHDVSKQMFARWQALLAPFDFEIHYKKEQIIVSLTFLLENI